jgi:hypothetical protein
MKLFLIINPVFVLEQFLPLFVYEGGRDKTVLSEFYTHEITILHHIND